MSTLTTKSIVQKGKHVVAQERLFLNEKRDKLVSANDPTAAFLFCAVGEEIDVNLARKFGLLEEPDAVPSPADIASRSTRVPKNLAVR